MDILKKLTLFVLEIIFLVSIYILSTHPFTMPLWLVTVTVFATMRMARTISENEIMEGLRAPFTETLPDTCGAGNGVVPKGQGVVRALGGLIACPICTGTWSALFLVAVYTLFPKFGIILIVVLGIAGGSEMLYNIGEWFSWGGRMFRVVCGSVSPDGEGGENNEN